ncbi:hypothetical protein G6F24_015561 [Rhizopus arrhizus]|nr:hypothetical protein G6F24_015561 [Rhizopus arrhizus]
MGITYWAAQRPRTTSDFYTAGGGLTGFQNGLAIAGDYLSAASFLGIAGMVYVSGFDGMIYAIGFLFGWPVVMFLIAERLRNLGRQRVAADHRAVPDRADGRCGQADRAAVRAGLQHCGIDRRVADDDLRGLRRHDRHDLGTDHQGSPDAFRRHADDPPGAGGL